jgi:hypothetical protein
LTTNIKPQAYELNVFIYPYPICQRTRGAFALSQKLKAEDSKACR